MASKKIDVNAVEAMKTSLEEMESSAAKVTDSFQTQLDLASQIRDSFASASKNVKDFGDTANKSLLTSEQWKEVEKALDDTTSASKTSKTWMSKLGDALKSDVAKGATIALGALDGFQQGLRNAVALTKGVKGLFGSMIGGAFSLTKAIISIPFRIMDGLFKMAEKGGGGTQLAEAYESVREVFGNLNSSASRTVVSIGKGMTSVQGATITGVRIWGNLAKQIEAANAMASAMGPAFNTVEKEMNKNGAAIMYYNKGLGITDDQMTLIASQALRMGVDVSKVQNSMTKQALGMAKAFGVNAKVLSRDMARAMTDLAHFGHLSSKEIAIATTYANKLGVSIDKLTGIMDATQTFESTAESMGKLNEVFGTNIDIQKMALEQDPAKKMEILRQEFNRAGKSIENLNVWERKLIAQNTGLDESAINAALSAKNMGVSYDKIARQGEKNERKVMSQAEAMAELSDSIKRIIEPLNRAGGIIDRIIQGINRGIQSSPQFLKIMENINHVFMDSFNFGMKLAKVLMGLSPSFTNAFNAISSVFDPKIFRSFFDDVLKSTKILEKKTPGAVGEFADAFFVNVEKFFSATGPGVTKFFVAVEKIGHGFMDVMSKIARWGFNKFADTIVEWFNAPKLPGIKQGTLVSALKPFLDGFVSIGHSAVDALLKVIPTMTEKLPGIFKSVEAAIKGMAKGAKFDSAVPEWARSLVDLFVKVKDVLVPEIKKLFWTMWPLVKPYVIDGLKFLFVTSFAPAVLKVALSAVTATFTSAVGGMLKDAVIGAFKAPKAAVTEGVEGVASSLGRSSTSAFSKVEGFFSKGIGKALGAAALVAVVADASIEVGAALKEFPDKLQDEGFDPATSKIAAGATGMVNALTLGLVPKSLQDDIAKSIAEVVKVLDDKVRDTFGPQFAESNKKYFASAFQVFGSVGDILVSLWKGDSKGFNEAADALFDGLMGLISSSIERLIVGIPFIFLKVQKFIMDSWSFMLSKAGDVSLALKDVPVVGPLFEYFGLGLKALSEIPKLIGELLDEAAEVVKGFKFSYFTEGWEKVSSVVRRVFTSISDFAKEAWEDTVRPFRQVGEALSSAFKPVMTGIDEVASSFSWIGDAFDSAVESISGGIEWVVDTLTSTAKTVFNVLSYPFDLWMDRVFGVVEAVYGNYKELAGFLREVGSKIFEVLMSPHTKGTAKVKAMWGVVTEGFSAIPDLLKSMGKRLFNAITSPYKKAYDAVTGLFSSDTFGKVFDEVVTVVSTSLEKLADSAPFKAVIDVAKKVFDIHSPSKEFTKVGDMVASGFTSAVTDIPEVAGKSFDATAAAARKMGKDVSSSMKDAVDVRGPDLASVVQSALRQSEDVANVIVQQSESLVASIDAATNSMARIVDAVSAGRISDVPLAAAGKSIKQFQKAISVIQRMDDALSRTPDVDISAKMAAVASRLGLGSSGVYTVKSKEVVINVNMNVTMDAGEVEKAIVHRSNSIIRDRINYALGSGDGKNNRVQQSIPETPEPLTKFAAGVN
jgi:hypothetical protein